MGYGNKIFSPVSRNDVTRSPGTTYWGWLFFSAMAKTTSRRLINWFEFQLWKPPGCHPEVSGSNCSFFLAHSQSVCFQPVGIFNKFLLICKCLFIQETQCKLLTVTPVIVFNYYFFFSKELHIFFKILSSSPAFWGISRNCAKVCCVFLVGNWDSEWAISSSWRELWGLRIF